MGKYYRITVVAMVTSCASGINRFGAQEFSIQGKVYLGCLLLYIFISVFTSSVFKKNIPKPPVISAVVLVDYSVKSYRQAEAY